MGKIITSTKKDTERKYGRSESLKLISSKISTFSPWICEKYQTKKRLSYVENTQLVS